MQQIPKYRTRFIKHASMNCGITLQFMLLTWTGPAGEIPQRKLDTGGDGSAVSFVEPKEVDLQGHGTARRILAIIHRLRLH